MTDPASPSPKPAFHEHIPRQCLALAGWVGFWLAAEPLLGHWGLDPRAQLTALLAVLAAATLAGILVARAWLFQLATSVRFALAQGAFLIGTVAVASRRGEVFRSLWFAALLAVLAGSMLAVTWKRRPYPLARLGFLLVHVAPALVFLGLLWGRLAGVRTLARLPAGATLDTLQTARGPLPLPGFRLRLERFDRVTGDPGLRVYAQVPPGAPRAFPAQAGTRAPLGAYRMELLEVLPDAVATGQVLENPLAPATPALRVVLGLGLDTPLVGQLLAGSPQLGRQDEPGGRFAVVFREAWDEGLLATLRPTPASEQLVLAAQGGALAHAVRAGASWALPGFTLNVIQIFPDFAVRPAANGLPEAYSRSPVPREPWAQLELIRPDGASARLLLSARNPELSDRLNAASLPAGVTLRYRREGGEYQRRFVVFTRQDRQVRLVQDGRVARTEPLELRRPFIVEPGLSVTPEHLMERAEPAFVAAPSGQGGPPRSPVLRARISDPRTGAAETQWLEARPDGAATPVVPFLGGQVILGLRDRLPEAADFRSELVLLDDQGLERARKLIRPGEPLDFRGYRFQQAAGDPDDPRLDGIEVVREPGLRLIQAGFCSLLLGCAWMFYLKPGLKRRAQDRQEARP